MPCSKPCQNKLIILGIRIMLRLVWLILYRQRWNQKQWCHLTVRVNAKENFDKIMDKNHLYQIYLSHPYPSNELMTNQIFIYFKFMLFNFIFSLRWCVFIWLVDMYGTCKFGTGDFYPSFASFGTQWTCTCESFWCNNEWVIPIILYSEK